MGLDLLRTESLTGTRELFFHGMTASLGEIGVGYRQGKGEASMGRSRPGDQDGGRRGLLTSVTTFAVEAKTQIKAKVKRIVSTRMNIAAGDGPGPGLESPTPKRKRELHAGGKIHRFARLCS